MEAIKWPMRSLPAIHFIYVPKFFFGSSCYINIAAYESGLMRVLSFIN